MYGHTVIRVWDAIHAILQSKISSRGHWDLLKSEHNWSLWGSADQMGRGMPCEEDGFWFRTPHPLTVLPHAKKHDLATRRTEAVADQAEELKKAELSTTCYFGTLAI